MELAKEPSDLNQLLFSALSLPSLISDGMLVFVHFLSIVLFASLLLSFVKPE
ncbi:hypothetical protein D3C71_1873330 [compost metagenome]